MKFSPINLISVWLPAVFAANQPISKILYDSGHMIIIAEAFTVTGVKYSYTKDSRLVFEIRRKASIARDLMKLRGRPKLSFVIETFNQTGLAADDDYCIQNSSEILRKFIVGCRGATAIRFELTKEEGKQIQRSKNERRGKGPFKVVVYAGGKFRAYTVGLDNFALANYESEEGATFFVLANNINNSSASIMVADSKSRTEGVFVIEGLPSYVWIDCKLINFSTLRPFSCKGNVVLRRFELFDADR